MLAVNRRVFAGLLLDSESASRPPWDQTCLPQGRRRQFVLLSYSANRQALIARSYCHPWLKLPGLSDDLFDGAAPSTALFAIENNMGDGSFA